MILIRMYYKFLCVYVSELAKYQGKELDSSMYYKETFGITPEQALKNVEKLQQMEELVASLEAEVIIEKILIIINNHYCCIL